MPDDDELPNATDRIRIEPADPTPADPAESLDATKDPAEEPENNGGMAQGDGRRNDEAVAAAQELIDSAYSYWGPDDRAGLLEIDS